MWRFASADAHHANPWYFYFGPVALKTAPLAALALLALALRTRGPLAVGEAPRSAFTRPDRLAHGRLRRALGRLRQTPTLSRPLYPAAALLSALLWDRIRPRLARPQWWERAWLGGFAVFALVAALQNPNEDDRASDYRPAFDVVASVRGGDRLLLLRPTEGLEGAAVFLTAEIPPKAADAPSLRALLAGGGAAIVVAECLASEANPLDSLGEGIAVTPIREIPFGRSRIMISRAVPGGTRTR